MRFFRYFALVVFFFDLPIPIYWFILHPFGNFWRRRVRAAFYIAGLGSWTAGAIFVALLHHRLLAPDSPSTPAACAGIALVAVDFILFFYSGKHLGHLKLVGHAELTGKTDLTTTGLYKYLRHPRYTGMISAVAGACLLCGTAYAWTVGAIWLACVLASIFLEEREMRHRFGAAYESYSRVTPRFFPHL